MNLKIAAGILAVTALFSFTMAGCTPAATGSETGADSSGSGKYDTMTYDYTEQDIVTPFWKTDVMYNESVMMIMGEDQTASAQLLFEPVKIISVRDSSLKKEYVEGVDYVYEDGKLKLCAGAKAPYLTTDQLYGKGVPSTVVCMPAKNTPTKKILFTETSYIFEHQLFVTYAYEKPADFYQDAPVYSAEKLPKVTAKLNAGENVRIVVYGDSIAAGCNASSTWTLDPQLPTWPNLIKMGLEQKYDSSIVVINPSVPGTVSEWGVQNAESLVANQSSDLVIIAFGMNDGTGQVKPDVYVHNIETIRSTVKAKNPDAEFILIAPPLANPESDYAGCQADYAEPLRGLEEEGTVVVDMCRLHTLLLERKTFTSMTANNINHPNDFLIRCYAMAILSTLCEY